MSSISALDTSKIGDKSIPEDVFTHYDRKELTPLYGHLPSQNLTRHMAEYRKSREDQIFMALSDMGMSGDKATSDFSIVNHYLVARVLNEVVSSPSSEPFSLSNFINSFNLAVVRVGGFGGGTMGAHSDLDLVILAPPDLDTSESNMSYHNGLKIVHAKGLDYFRMAWDPTIEIETFRPNDITEVVKQVANLDPKRIIVNDNNELFTRIVSLRNAQFILGERQTFLSVMNSFYSDLANYSDGIMREICIQTRKRHEAFGALKGRIAPDLKDSPGYYRDIEAIESLIMIHNILNKNQDSELSSVLSNHESKRLAAAKSITLQLKYTLHHDYNKRGGQVSKEINLLTPEKMISAFRTFKGITSPTIDNGRDALLLLQEHAENVLTILGSVIERVVPECEMALSFPGAARRTYSPLHVVSRKIEALSEAAKEVINTLYGLVVDTARRTEGLRSIAVLPLEEQAKLRDLRRAALRLNAAELHDQIFQDALQDLIFDPARAGLTFKYLHEAGLLDKIFPSFREIKHFAEFNSYHITTVDASCLNAVEVLGAVWRGEIPELAFLTDIVRSVDDPRSLILALLLHDVGRKCESIISIENGTPLTDHAKLGQAMVEGDLKELGLNELIGECGKLVLHHSVLLQKAYGLDSLSSSVLEELAELIRDQDFLDKLFVLHFIDKYTSNQEAFNEAKQRWLISVYNGVTRVLDSKSAATSYQTELVKSVRCHLAQLSSIDFDIQEHLASLPEAYAIECDPLSIAQHIYGINQIREGQSNTYASLIPVSTNSNLLWDLIIVARDRDRLFLDIADLLVKSKININSAYLATTKGDSPLACNVFSVSPFQVNNSYRIGRHITKPINFSGILGFEDKREDLLKRLITKMGTSADRLDPLTPPSKEILEQISGLTIQIVRHSNSEKENRQNNSIDMIARSADVHGLAYVMGYYPYQAGLSTLQAKLGTGNGGPSGVKNIFRLVNSDRSEITDQQIDSVKSAFRNIANSIQFDT